MGCGSNPTQRTWWRPRVCGPSRTPSPSDGATFPRPSRGVKFSRSAGRPRGGAGPPSPHHVVGPRARLHRGGRRRRGGSGADGPLQSPATAASGGVGAGRRRGASAAPPPSTAGCSAMTPQIGPRGGRPQHYVGGGARGNEDSNAAGAHAGGGASFPLGSQLCWVGGPGLPAPPTGE